MNVNKEGYTWEVSEDGEVVYTPIKKQFAQSWGELGSIDGYFVDDTSNTYQQESSPETLHNYDRNIFKTEPQAKASIAVAQLTHLLYEVHEGWEANWMNGANKYLITLISRTFRVEVYCTHASLLSFETAEKATNFLATHKKLIKEAAPILFGVVL